jgi:hypothetical protein
MLNSLTSTIGTIILRFFMMHGVSLFWRIGNAQSLRVASLAVLLSGCAPVTQSAHEKCISDGWASGTSGYNRCLYAHQAVIACRSSLDPPMCALKFMDRYDRQNETSASDATRIPPQTGSLSNEQRRQAIQIGHQLISCAGFQLATSDLLSNPDAIDVARQYGEYYRTPALIFLAEDVVGMTWKEAWAYIDERVHDQRSYWRLQMKSDPSIQQSMRTICDNLNPMIEQMGEEARTSFSRMNQ